MSNYFLSKFLVYKNKSSKSKTQNLSTTTSKDIYKLDIDKLNLLVGVDENGSKVFIPNKGLFQNILVTGTIGSGKTSSLLYPFAEQLIKYNSYNKREKLAMLILDVKGNFYKQMLIYSEKYNRLDDVVVIELGGRYKYNPLDKPDLKPQVLANRLISILSLFSNNTSDSYWLDKAEQTLTEAIKLCRLYNDNYVTFEELHKIILYPNYYKEKVTFLKEKYLKKELSTSEILVLSSVLDFFQNEFFSIDNRVLSIIKSEISRITNTFVSDPIVKSTFNPKKIKLIFMVLKMY